MEIHTLGVRIEECPAGVRGMAGPVACSTERSGVSNGFVPEGYKRMRFVRVGARKWVRLVFLVFVAIFRGDGVGRRWHD